MQRGGGASATVPQEDPADSVGAGEAKVVLAQDQKNTLKQQQANASAAAGTQAQSGSLVPGVPVAVPGTRRRLLYNVLTKFG